jgi:hypothetical protein
MIIDSRGMAYILTLSGVLLCTASKKARKQGKAMQVCNSAVPSSVHVEVFQLLSTIAGNINAM